MTDLLRAFDESKVKRGTGATGGQFTSKGAAPPAKGKTGKGGKGAGPRRGDAGNLSFDGRRGTGYGTRGGDRRVRALQEALNRLGLTDASGKKLAVDGQLGPRTTAAIKKAQRKLGLKPDGIVTPALLKRLTSAKSLGKAPAEFVRKPGDRNEGAAGRPSRRKGDRSPKERAPKKAPRKRAARKEKPAPTKRATAPASGQLARSADCSERTQQRGEAGS